LCSFQTAYKEIQESNEDLRNKLEKYENVDMCNAFVQTPVNLLESCSQDVIYTKLRSGLLKSASVNTEMSLLKREAKEEFKINEFKEEVDILKNQYKDILSRVKNVNN